MHAIGTPHHDPANSGPSRAGRGWPLAAVALAVLLAAAVIQAAIRHGRFEVLPDAPAARAYAHGAAWADLLHREGLAAIVADYLAHPPPALYAPIAAAAGFVLFGFHDWAPLAANAILAVLCFVLVGAALRETPARQRLAGLVLGATIPLAAVAIHEVRSEIAAGLLAAAGALLLVERPLGSVRARRAALAGAAFGGAFLADATLWPHAAALLALALVLGAVADSIGGAVHRAAWSRAAAMAVGVALLVALPHAAALWRAGVDLTPAATEATWPTENAARVRLRWFINGPDGSVVLGKSLYLLVALVGAGACLAAHRWRRAELARTLAAGLLLVAAWLMPIATPAPRPFGAVAFQALLVLLAVFALGRLLAAERRAGHRWATVLLVASLGAGVLAFRWTFAPADPGGPDARAQRTLADAAARVHASIRDTREPEVMERVLIACPDLLDPNVLRYWARRDRTGLSFDAPTAARPQDADRALEEHDFVLIATGPNAPEPARALADAVRARGDFERLVATPSGRPGLTLAAYRKAGPFAGYDVVSGLGGLEGPYPQWSMPRVRWGLGPATHLRVAAERPTTVRLYGEGRAIRFGQAVTVRLDGRDVAQVPIERGDWRRIDIRLALAPGDHDVELAYETWDRDDRALAVVFRRLVVTPEP